MPINGNGVATSTGKQLLQIIPINIVTLLTVIATAVGLYYKFDARIVALENSRASAELQTRVLSLETKMDAVTPVIIRTDTNVLWLMSNKPVPPR